MLDVTNLRGYGDVARLKHDALVVRDIFARQGIAFLIDSLAECIGTSANAMKLSAQERERVREHTMLDFENAITERL